MDTKKLVTRLRASYEESRTAECDEGRQAGVAWATEDAEYTELAWLADTPDSAADLSGWNVEGSPFDNYAESEFWERSAGLERIPSEHYVRCFVTGAVETFEEVRPNVEA